MSCLWLLQTFIVLFIYTDLHRLKQFPRFHKHHHYGGTTDSNSVAHTISHRSARTDYDEDIYKQISPPTHFPSRTQSPRRRGSQRTESVGSSDADSLIETAENVISDPTTFRNINSPTHDASKAALVDGHVSVETDYGLINGSMSREETLSRQSSQEYIDTTEGSLNDFLQGKSKLKFMYQGEYCNAPEKWNKNPQKRNINPLFFLFIW